MSWTSCLVSGVLRRFALGAVVLMVAACGGGADPESRSRALGVTSLQSAATDIVELATDVAPEIVGLRQVAERRISRTVFEYEFQVEVRPGRSTYTP